MFGLLGEQSILHWLCLLLCPAVVAVVLVVILVVFLRKRS